MSDFDDFVWNMYINIIAQWLIIRCNFSNPVQKNPSYTMLVNLLNDIAICENISCDLIGTLSPFIEDISLCLKKLPSHIKRRQRQMSISTRKCCS
nr:unnamed protein product [Callosobruchus chinensis]